MSYREVNELRKNGRLNDAFTMAEADLERCRDSWSCKALFWCLNDKAKASTGEELLTILGRMREMAEIIGQDDYVDKALSAIVRRSIPHSLEVKDASVKSKVPGQAMTAYETISSLYERGELDATFYKEFGWIIYRALHENNEDDTHRRKCMLNNYLHLELERPSLLHSLILSEAVRIEKATPLAFLFSAFLNLWDLQYLREEDWIEGENHEGIKLPSLVEKVITVYVKEMQITPNISPSEDFLNLLDKALDKYPQNENLLRYKAILFAKAGNKEKAIIYYKNLLIKSSNKFYLWHELADIVDDQDLKIGLLCKALNTEAREDFIGKIRIELAGLFCDKQMYGNAIFELNKVREVYTTNTWHLPPAFNEQFNRLPQNIVPTDNKYVYPKYIAKAEDFEYSELPSEYVVKVADRKIEEPLRNPSHGKTSHSVIKWTLLKENGNVVGIKPNHFHLGQKINNGQCFEVKSLNERIVMLKPIDLPMCEWIRRVNGVLSIKTNREGKHFGYVGKNYYVPEKLLGNYAEGTNVMGIAVRQDNRWRMVSLNIVHTINE